jgi:hypothetical protein
MKQESGANETVNVPAELCYPFDCARNAFPPSERQSVGA